MFIEQKPENQYFLTGIEDLSDKIQEAYEHIIGTAEYIQTDLMSEIQGCGSVSSDLEQENKKLQELQEEIAKFTSVTEIKPVSDELTQAANQEINTRQQDIRNTLRNIEEIEDIVNNLPVLEAASALLESQINDIRNFQEIWGWGPDQIIKHAEKINRKKQILGPSLVTTIQQGRETVIQALKTGKPYGRFDLINYLSKKDYTPTEAQTILRVLFEGDEKVSVGWCSNSTVIKGLEGGGGGLLFWLTKDGPPTGPEGQKAHIYEGMDEKQAIALKKNRIIEVLQNTDKPEVNTKEILNMFNHLYPNNPINYQTLKKYLASFKDSNVIDSRKAERNVFWSLREKGVETGTE